MHFMLQVRYLKTRIAGIRVVWELLMYELEVTKELLEDTIVFLEKFGHTCSRAGELATFFISAVSFYSLFIF